MKATIHFILIETILSAQSPTMQHSNNSVWERLVILRLYHGYIDLTVNLYWQKIVYQNIRDCMHNISLLFTMTLSKIITQTKTEEKHIQSNIPWFQIFCLPVVIGNMLLWHVILHTCLMSADHNSPYLRSLLYFSVSHRLMWASYI